MTAVAAAAACCAAPATAQVPAPADVLGFEPGADYRLATYDQILEYFRKLDAASDRIRVDTIGRSVLGRPLILAYISSPENLARLDHWRSVGERLARAGGLAEVEARRLAREGKAIVWIDAGLHADEVAPAQLSPLLAHRLVTREDDEARRIRDDVVLLLMPVMGPDGLDVITRWYGRHVGTPFQESPIPVLYHQYAGVDANRDWYMMTQPETRAVAYQLYRRWYPQIVYNQHQAPPFPSRILVPPYAEPVNPDIPPGVVRGVNLVGAAMAQRFEREGKSGVISREAFDMWWNGGMRSAPYYHNMIGILTETAQNTFANPRHYPPDSLPAFLGGTAVSSRHPSVFYANPWPGGWWRLRDAVEYNYTASMAVLDIASRLREDWLYGIYQLGREAIARGEAGGPFAYVIPAAQWDPGEAVELAQLLRRAGVEVRRATAEFRVGDVVYPASSYVLYAAQAFRQHLVNLMERQVYPDRRAYPGGPPVPPYDLSGWTLPLQMGVQVARVERPFEAATEALDSAAVGPGRVGGAGPYYLFSDRPNAAATALNRLLAQGERVSRAGAAFAAGGRSHPAGTFVVRSGPRTRARLERLAGELGLDFSGISEPPSPLRPLRRARVGLYKSWIGDWVVNERGRWDWVANIGEGWTRWVLERHDFPLDTLHDADIRSRDLSRYDVVILPEQLPDVILKGHAAGTMPPGFTGGIGEEGAARLRRYVEAGGTLLAIDAAANLAIDLFRLPLRDVTAGLPQSELFVPGTLLRLELDDAHPLASGMRREGTAFFVRSRGFEVVPGPAGEAVRVVARYPRAGLLQSGWALGADEHLGGRAAVVEAPVGKGRVVLIGFRPLFRGQPRNTFRLVFNTIHEATTR